MKKLLVLMLVFGIVSAASATIIDVVATSDGTNTHSGTIADKLDVGEQIWLNLVLVANPHPTSTYSSYNGYLLSSVDVDLDISSGTLAIAKDTATGIIKDPKVSDGFDAWTNGTITSTTIPGFSAVSSAGINGTNDTTDRLLVINIKVTPDAASATAGQIVVNIDQGATISEYSVYGNPKTWLSMVDADFGDLTLYVTPEPMTMALLGVGGLFLRRRKK